MVIMKSLINWIIKKQVVFSRLILRGKFYIFAILAISLLLMFTSTSVFAHGVNINYESDMTYRIEAKFDNGQPIVNGQVTIYAPNNPTEVWGEGFTNEEGVYFFTPDQKIAGDWTIKIRQAGHGSLITIPIGVKDALICSEEAIGNGATSGTTGFSLSQKLLMVACVVWGAVGTALYFKRRVE